MRMKLSKAKFTSPGRVERRRRTSASAWAQSRAVSAAVSSLYMRRASLSQAASRTTARVAFARNSDLSRGAPKRSASIG